MGFVLVCNDHMDRDYSDFRSHLWHPHREVCIMSPEEQMQMYADREVYFRKQAEYNKALADEAKEAYNRVKNGDDS
jgi:hypothetical protein